MTAARFAAVTSAIALCAALGGTSFAAATLAAGSVGTAQLKVHAVTAAKLRVLLNRLADWATGLASGGEDGDGVTVHAAS